MSAPHDGTSPIDTPTVLAPVPILTLKQESILIGVLAAVNFTHIMDFVIMMPLGPQFFRAFQINTQQFSLIVSSYTFAAAISGIISSLFIDRYDRKNALLFLYAGFIIGTFLCAFAPTYPLLIGARIVAGAFGGVAGGLVMAIVADVIPVARRGKAMGMIMAAFSVSSVVGVPIGLYFANLFSWHAPFVGLAAMGLVVWIGALKVMPNIISHLGGVKKQPLKELASIVSDRNHLRALSLTSIIMMGGFTVIPFLSPYMVSNMGLSEAQLPLIYLCGGAATFFTSQLFGRLADRFGKHRMYYLICSASIVPILLITNMPPLPVWLTLVCSTLFMVLVSGRFVPAMTIISGSTIPAQRGGFMSVNASVQQASAGLAAAVAGMVLIQDGNGPIRNYWLVGVIATLFSLSSILVARRIQIRT